MGGGGAAIADRCAVVAECSGGQRAADSEIVGSPGACAARRPLDGFAWGPRRHRSREFPRIARGAAQPQQLPGFFCPLVCFSRVHRDVRAFGRGMATDVSREGPRSTERTSCSDTKSSSRRGRLVRNRDLPDSSNEANGVAEAGGVPGSLGLCGGRSDIGAELPDEIAVGALLPWRGLADSRTAGSKLRVSGDRRRWNTLPHMCPTVLGTVGAVVTDNGSRRQDRIDFR